MSFEYGNRHAVWYAEYSLITITVMFNSNFNNAFIKDFQTYGALKNYLNCLSYKICLKLVIITPKSKFSGCIIITIFIIIIIRAVHYVAINKTLLYNRSIDTNSV